MAAFTFDTSGTVRRPGFARPLSWGDLSPFEQGFVEAAARAFWEGLGDDVGAAMAHLGHKVCFSDLAPDTLAAILKDCESFLERMGGNAPAARGRGFWAGRQRGVWADFGLAPLTPYLGDDGRLHLKAAP